MESWVSLGGKEGRTNIRVSAKPGIEPGILWPEGRDLTKCADHAHPRFTKRKKNRSCTQQHLKSNRKRRGQFFLIPCKMKKKVILCIQRLFNPNDNISVLHQPFQASLTLILSIQSRLLWKTSLFYMSTHEFGCRGVMLNGLPGSPKNLGNMSTQSWIFPCKNNILVVTSTITFLYV